MPPAVPVSPEAPRRIPAGPSAPLPEAEPGRSVLVAGCIAERELLGRILQRFGCAIVGEEALLRPGVSPVAAIIGDDADAALTLCKRLAPSCPVLLIASDVAFDIRREASAAGVTGLVQRPVNPIELSEWIAHLVEEAASPCSILIVDDDIIMSEINAEILRAAKFDVTTVSDPKLVLDHLDTRDPDLVLMDVQMPDVDGIELTKIIRQTRRFVSLPIVFLSAERDEARQFAARRLGGDDFVMKPVEPARLIEIVRLRTERTKVLRSMIERDRLTGLYNPVAFRDRVAFELERSVRSGSTFSFALLDVDHFKQVNDTHGHAVGDNVLRGLAGLLQADLRKIDVIGRMGGEEFGVILADAPLEHAVLVLDRLRERFRALRFQGAGDAFSVTFSAGVVAARRGHAAGSDLFLLADTALYRAKASGRNCIETGQRATAR